MITIIFRMTMQEGKEDEAIEQANKMASAVQVNEPGVLAYACHRSIDNPSEIVFFEAYKDDAAMKEHGQTAHMGEFRGSIAQLFDVSKVKIERLDRVGGFLRGD